MSDGISSVRGNDSIANAGDTTGVDVPLTDTNRNYSVVNEIKRF